MLNGRNNRTTGSLHTKAKSNLKKRASAKLQNTEGYKKSKKLMPETPDKHADTLESLVEISSPTRNRPLKKKRTKYKKRKRKRTLSYRELY